MFDKVIFYNQFGNGDIFESREFVKVATTIIPADKFFYAHKKNHRTLVDIENIEYLPWEDSMFRGHNFYIKNNILYFNTWIGKKGLKYGCSVESIYDLFNDTFEEIGLGSKLLPGVPVDYIPKINYEKFQIDSCNKFLSEHQENKVLICNGNVLSGQANNFDFTTSINYLASIFKNKTFIVTQKCKIDQQNIYFTDDITKTTDSFDINEISYLSTFCTEIIGRYSGPHTCSQVKENLFDSKKTLITFTYRKAGCLITNNENIKIRKIWSPEFTPNKVAEVIKFAIESEK